MRYAPIVLLSCLVGMAFSISPVYLASVSVFIKPLASEFGWGRLQVSGAVSVATLLLAVCSPMVGSMLDRYGPRRLILVGTTLFSAAIASMALLKANYVVYLAIAAAIGISGASSNSFVYLSVLPNWFDKRFGLSLGIAMLGVGIGQLAAPIYASALVSHFGWRTAYAAIGLIVFAVTFPTALLLLRDRPKGSTTKSAQQHEFVAGFTRAEAIAHPAFWRLSLSFFFITVAASGCIVHLIPMLTDRGVASADAAKLAALIGSSLMVGRLVTGVLLDRLSATWIGVVCFGGATCGIALLMLNGHGSLTALGIVLVGLAFGVEGDLMAFMTRRVFGMRAYGAIYGLMFGIFNAGIVLGPLVMGFSFDRTQSYFDGLGALIAMAGTAMVLIGWPSYGETFPTEIRPRAS